MPVHDEPGSGREPVTKPTGKEAAALYYARNVLPTVGEKVQRMVAEDRSAIEIDEAAFATV